MPNKWLTSIWWQYVTIQWQYASIQWQYASIWWQYAYIWWQYASIGLQYAPIQWQYTSIRLQHTPIWVQNVICQLPTDMLVFVLILIIVLKIYSLCISSERYCIYSGKEYKLRRFSNITFVTV